MKTRIFFYILSFIAFASAVVLKNELYYFAAGLMLLYAYVVPKDRMLVNSFKEKNTVEEDIKIINTNQSACSCNKLDIFAKYVFFALLLFILFLWSGGIYQYGKSDNIRHNKITGELQAFERDKGWHEIR